MITLLNSPFFVPVLVFAGISFLFFAIKLVMDQSRSSQSIHDRASRWGAQTGKIYDKKDTQKTKEPGTSNGFLGFFRLTGKNKKKSATGIYSDTPLDFQRAGLYDPAHIRAYQVSRVLLTILPFLGFVLYLMITGQHVTTKNSMIAVYVGVVFFLLPMFWMRRRVNKRKQEFEKAFPNAMDLLVVCVEAGMGFDAAITRVSREMELTSPLLAREFKVLSLELQTGKPRNECMGNLGKRINLADVDNLVSLLVQAEKFGTGIAHPLRIHAEEMREKRYNKMEEIAAKLPVKLSFPLVFCIFPAMMISLIGPAVIQVYRQFVLM